MSSKPELNQSSRESMKGFRSLTARYIVLGLIIFALITSFTALSFFFTRNIDNDAKRINIAGRERMLSFKIAWLLNKAVRETGENRITSLNELRNETLPLFEENMYALRYGSEKYGLKPLSKKNDYSRIDILIKKWQQEVKPLLAGAIKDIEQGETASIEGYNVFVKNYVNEIDAFVGYLVKDYESELRVYGNLRIAVIIPSALIFVALGLFVRKRLVIPITRLRDAAKEIEKGNFDVMLDIKSRDEIGILTGSVNQMAQTLRLLFGEKLRHIEEVLALADASNVLNALPLQENIYEVVCKVAVKNFNLKMVWLGLVDEKTYDVNPVAHAGYEEDYLSDVRFTWDDSPDGVKTTCIALRTKLPEIINDVYNFPVDTYWKIEAVKRGYRSALSLPLIFSENRTIGVLNLYSSEQNFFSEEREKLFHTFANQASIAIENRRYCEKLAEDLIELRKLSLAVEQSPSTVVITDMDGNIEYVNPKFTKITGYTLEEVKGKNPRILQSDMTPLEVYKDLWETITSGREWNGEWQNRKKNGEIYWASVNIFPIKDHKGNFTHFLAEEVDITERKNAEEALRKNNERLEEQFRVVATAKQEWQDTFDNITDMIFIHDRDFIVLRANMAFAKYFGLSPAEMIGKNCHDLFYETDSPVLSCPYALALDKGQEVTIEVFIPTSNRIFRMSSFPFYIGERDVRSFICIAKDITEEKEKEMRLIMSERLASLGQIASGIAHEINNPMATISGCTEGLLLKIRKGQIDPGFFESYLRMIEEEVLRCKDITTGMLSFVRKTTYEKMDININELLDETLKIIGLHSRLQDVEVKKSYAIEMPHIYANKGELRQVFLIMITNAIDAIEDKATITLETGTEDDNTVSIKISDTGLGISPEHINRIYDPFFTTKSDKGGTGLGLSIAHQIITNHNGSISVTSGEGRGTTFEIKLPV